jgi:hypothetical protein
MVICSIFCIYVFELLSVYYKYSELGLVELILCFHDKPVSSGSSVQGKRNNDFATVL